MDPINLWPIYLCPHSQFLDLKIYYLYKYTMYSTRDDNWNYVRFTVEDFFVNTTSSSKKSGRAVSVWTVLLLFWTKKSLPYNNASTGGLYISYDH